MIIPLGLGSAFAMLGDAAIYTILPLHIDEMKISIIGTGILLGVNRIIRIFSNNIYGYLYDIGNKKYLYTVSLLLGSVSTLFFAFFYGFWPLFISRILWGIAWSGISIGSTSIIILITDNSIRGKWFGIQQLCFIFGKIVGSLIGGFISDLISFRGAMAVNGILSLSSTVIVFLLMPDIGGQSRKSFQLSYVKDIFTVFKTKNQQLYLSAAVLGISRLVFSGFMSSLISIITRNKISPFISFVGISTLTGLIDSSKSFISMTTAPLIGIFSDKINDRLNRWTSLSTILGIGCLGLFMISLSNPWLTVTGLLLCAIPGSSIGVLIRTIIGENSNIKNSGQSLGFVLTAGDLAASFGPPLAFLLLSILGINLMFQLLSILLLCTIFCIRIFK